MKIHSPNFENGEQIPEKYTCEGENINPQINFENIPEGAKSLALIMDDPDVPVKIMPDGVYDHWLVWNIPPETRMLEEATTPPGVEGKNTGNKIGYTGPCPPDREHRYFFRLYALDAELGLNPETATRQDLEQAMAGHILEKAELMGRYNKKH